jgi:putative nucleotidyltransferase with HDIG domain
MIPTLHTIADRVFGVLDNSNSSFTDLSDIVRYDQAITSKIISIANSAYYSRGVEIFNLQRAMLTIGFEEVRSIVTCILLMEGIMKILKLGEEDLLSLWQHSIEVACAARLLSEHLMIEDPQKAFTASLLHDIGRIIFYAFSPEYREIQSEVRPGMDLAALEREQFGIDHQETGHIIAVKWKLPADFAKVVRNHHKELTDSSDGLIRLVAVSDRFFTKTQKGNTPEGLILERERDAIALEVQKIMKFMQLDMR